MVDTIPVLSLGDVSGVGVCCTWCWHCEWTGVLRDGSPVLVSLAGCVGSVFVHWVGSEVMCPWSCVGCVLVLLVLFVGLVVVCSVVGVAVVVWIGVGMAAVLVTVCGWDCAVLLGSGGRVVLLLVLQAFLRVLVGVIVLSWVRQGLRV